MRGSRNPPAPTKKALAYLVRWSFLFCLCVRLTNAGGFEQQQRRPLPAAEIGRSCWGCGQQDARAAQGTKQPLGAATRVPFLRGSRNPPAPTKKPQHIQVQGILVRLAFDFPSAFEILTVGLFSCISICCSCFIRFIFARLTLKQKTRVVKPFG